MNLFEYSEPAHDPGGKVKLKLPDHVVSEAQFSTCGRYRTLLTRTWDVSLPTCMFIAMNPSTATEHVDDPTIRKECTYARSWGYGALVKCNVMDYRQTNPKLLLQADVTPQTANNLQVIAQQLTQVELVVCAWGRLPDKLQPYAQKVINILKNHPEPVYCLGVNQDGSPRHPLYLKASEPLQPFPL